MYHLRYMRRSLSSSTAFAQRRSCIHHGRMPSTLKQMQPATVYQPRTLSVLMPSNYRKVLYTSSSLVLQASSLPSLETDIDIDSNDNILSADSIITDELNPSQKEATLRPRYSITRVIAGPGAGKTRVLICRIAHLLLDNDNESTTQQQPDSSNNQQLRNKEGILAVTFTKKAALEMERRLTDLISLAIEQEQKQKKQDSNGGAIITQQDSLSATISTGGDDYEDYLEDGEFVQFGNAPVSASDAENNISGDAESISRQYMRQTTVGTFHSVCSKILRKYGKELGDLPSVRSALGITNASGASVIQEGIQTSDDESIERDTSNDILIDTLDGSFTILDQSDQLRLLKEALQKHNIQLSSPASSSGGARKNNDIRPITVLNAISLLNTHEATKSTPGGSRQSDDEEISTKMSRKVYKIAMEIRTSFQRAKYSQSAVDFDDLILLTRELLLHHPDIRETLHRRWRHILVDEFQDTSQVQLDLVRLLTTNSLFVVGDGDQSIYSWRGASPESMSDFELAFHNRQHGWEGLLTNHNHNNGMNLSQYLAHITGEEEDSLEVKSVYLMENYRSTTNIVKAAQRIISDKGDKNNNNAAQENIRREMKPFI